MRHFFQLKFYLPIFYVTGMSLVIKSMFVIVLSLFALSQGKRSRIILQINSIA